MPEIKAADSFDWELTVTGVAFLLTEIVLRLGSV
jgi:hypothetical protein